MATQLRWGAARGYVGVVLRVTLLEWCWELRWSGVESYVGVVLGGYVGALFGLARGAKFYNHFWKRVK